jgi:hypothetical protein
VVVTVLAKSPGVADELFAARVFGMNHPLGFQLKATAKGVVVSRQHNRKPSLRIAPAGPVA